MAEKKKVVTEVAEAPERKGAASGGIRVAVVDGDKMLVLGGRTLLGRDEAQVRLALLRRRVEEELPAARSKLDADELLGRARSEIDRRIAAAETALTALETAVEELNAP